MEETTRENGRTIKWMAKESLNGQMIENTMVIILKIRSTVMVNLNGQMAENTKDNGSMENK